MLSNMDIESYDVSDSMGKVFAEPFEVYETYDHDHDHALVLTRMPAQITVFFMIAFL